MDVRPRAPDRVEEHGAELRGRAVEGELELERERAGGVGGR